MAIAALSRERASTRQHSYLQLMNSHPARHSPADTNKRDRDRCLGDQYCHQASATHLPDLSDEECGSHDNSKQHERGRPDIPQHERHYRERSVYGFSRLTYWSAV